MKIKKLLPIALMATSLLIGCGGGGGGGGGGGSLPDEHDDGHHAITIVNEDALKTDFYSGGISRVADVTLTVDGQDYSAETALYNDELSLISADSEIISVNGLTLLSGTKVGKVLVAFKFFDTVKHLEIEVTNAPSGKDIYGTDHDGTQEDPFTNEDAITAAKYFKEQGYDTQTVKLYVQGEVDSFYHAPGSGNKGDKTVCSWYFKPAEGKTEKFEAYIVKKDDGTEWTFDDIWVGGTVVLEVSQFNNYNDQYETGTNKSKLISCTGEKPEIHTITATVAEAIAAGRELDHQGVTVDKYAITGYVVKKSGDNYFMADTAAVAEHDYDMFELYSVKDAALAAKLTKNANVTVTTTVKRYGQTTETAQIETAVIDSIDVNTEGGTWEVIPEPAVETKTIAEFIALENVLTKAYEVTGTVKTYSANKYGNMTLTDGENDLTIYGSSATASYLKWNDADAYVVASNPQDFLTNDLTKDIKVGDTLKMKLVRKDYNTTVQGTGLVLEVNGGGEGGGGEGGDPIPVGTNINLTAANVLNYSGTNVAYKAGEATVENVKFSYTEIGAYGNGIQMRVKEGKASNIHNVDEFGKGIQKIEITLNSGKQVYDNTDVWAFKFGASSAVDGETVKLSTVANQLTYTVTPEVKTYTFFDMTKIIEQYTFYVDSINVFFVQEN